MKCYDSLSRAITNYKVETAASRLKTLSVLSRKALFHTYQYSLLIATGILHSHLETASDTPYATVLVLSRETPISTRTTHARWWLSQAVDMIPEANLRKFLPATYTKLMPNDTQTGIAYSDKTLAILVFPWSSLNYGTRTYNVPDQEYVSTVWKVGL